MGAGRSIVKPGASGADRWFARSEIHLFEHFTERHRQRFVDDDAERAFVGCVFTDQRDRLREIGVFERRHRHQKLIREGRLGFHDASMRLTALAR